MGLKCGRVKLVGREWNVGGIVGGRLSIRLCGVKKMGGGTGG